MKNRRCCHFHHVLVSPVRSLGGLRNASSRLAPYPLHCLRMKQSRQSHMRLKKFYSFQIESLTWQVHEKRGQIGYMEMNLSLTWGIAVAILCCLCSQIVKALITEEHIIFLDRIHHVSTSVLVISWWAMGMCTGRISPWHSSTWWVTDSFLWCGTRTRCSTNGGWFLFSGLCSMLNLSLGQCFHPQQYG